jgi:hypothetical protein
MRPIRPGALVSASPRTRHRCTNASALLPLPIRREAVAVKLPTARRQRAILLTPPRSTFVALLTSPLLDILAKAEPHARRVEHRRGLIEKGGTSNRSPSKRRQLVPMKERPESTERRVTRYKSERSSGVTPIGSLSGSLLTVA